MGTTSRSSHSMRDETILGAGRLEQVHLMVDERLRESQQARMAAGEGGRIRHRIGAALVALGTAVAGGSASVSTRRSMARSSASTRLPDAAHAGSGR